MRRRDVSRIEGFSDAVFGFALTLLVVSLEVPADFSGLRETLSGFLPFAVTFAVVTWIWYEHYLFFRRFGPEDGPTVTLNSLLLFVVLFFVYPLKFVFTRLFDTSRALEGLTAADARMLMLVYSAGFVAVFLVFVLLYWNAKRQRVALGLNELDVYDAAAAMRRHLLSVALGVTSCLLAATVPPPHLWMPGMLYTLLGPVHGTNGYINGRARARLRARLSSTPAPQ